MHPRARSLRGRAPGRFAPHPLIETAMANYIASARSNSFCVKDIAALEAAMPDDIDVYVESISERRVTLLVTNSDGGGWPSMIYNESTDEFEDWDIQTVVSDHLEDGEWCVIQEVGAERLRYLVGYSTAFNNKGEVITISIDDIFTRLPDGVTNCCY